MANLYAVVTFFDSCWFTIDIDDVSTEFIIIFIIELGILVIRVSGKSVRSYFVFRQTNLTESF